ncbi:MAG: HAMP domain-containing sensor histidine kinase [Pseudomonadota bacterium]
MFSVNTLSGRLLLLTVTIVMMAEVFVFLPSVARYREDYLSQRLQMAQIASLALLAADDAMVEDALERELLKNAEVSSIVLRRDLARQLILQAPLGAEVAATYDLRDVPPWTLIGDALAVLFRSEARTIRVIGDPMKNAGQGIEITMAEAPLRSAMLAFGKRILILSLIISTVTGVLVFFICRRLIVRPMERVVENIVAFQKDPERAPTNMTGGSRLVEIARAERSLSEMQHDVRSALLQKTRLAELGAAVAKISHDLRNMLASAQLMADRLDGSKDPVVSRIGPKLIGSIDRAAQLCVSTLRHGKAEEAPPEPREVVVQRLIEDVADAVFDTQGGVRLETHVDPDLRCYVDQDHLFRVLVNLTRNAREALDTQGGAGLVTVTATHIDDRTKFTIADNGPGMPAKAIENIFQPFLGGARRGGSGLGLAIAFELASANGGELTLISSTTDGTVFELSFPA